MARASDLLSRQTQGIVGDQWSRSQALAL